MNAPDQHRHELPQIAVVGMAYRLPGAAAGTLWEALLAGADLVTAVEPSRWAQDSLLHPRKSEPGSAYTFAAGSIGDVSGFDAAFFGISPREAAQMDPQQRVLLELAWEAIEHAGILPASLKGSRCGVYVGISGLDYGFRRADDFCGIDATTMTGNTASIAANRLSYAFDLRGPSIAVDTACSSSLVALHQACLAMGAGECAAALVGAINLHLHPFAFIGFSRAAMLSPRGACRVFDADGDGYVRAEGGAVLLLKRLDEALADGNRILALIAGSGVNCDGRTNGLTVPSAEAQAALLREVYARAGIAPAQIDYVEAHGTGTAVGDPIEAHALGTALGVLRPAGCPLPIGSVKSNLGHLEAAAGMAGLVKALLSIMHRRVPPTIGLRTPNPNIRFAEWNLLPVTEALPLDAQRQPVIGINSFGFGGANAHVVLRGYPAPAPPREQRARLLPPLLLGARGTPALQAAARDMASHLRQRKDLAYYDIAYGAAFRRELHSERLAAWGGDRDAIAEALERFADGGTHPRLVTATGLGQALPPVFVYSGNGSQWAGMGQRLLAEDQLFREAVAEVDALFAARGGFCIADELRAPPARSRLEITEVAQPTLFAVQVGVTRMLRSRGLLPGAVLGHSVGEVAAAWASGALDLAQAVEVIHERSIHQGRTKGLGQMTAVAAGEDEVAHLLQRSGLAAALAIAGINSPRGVTLSGPVEALAAFERCAGSLRFKRLDLDYAFHSAAMDGVAQGLQRALAGLRPRRDSIPFWSAVTGVPLPGTALDAGYWWRNVREPVRFRQAIEGLLAQGMCAFVEIGPHPVLRGYVGECIEASALAASVVPTLLRTDAGQLQVERAFHQLLAAGVPAQRSLLFPFEAAFVDLPHYPWQRERHWHPTSSESLGYIQRRKLHPLLGYRLGSEAGQWENHLDTALVPALADHVVGGAVVLPAAGLVDMALAAAADWRPQQTWDIEGLEIHAPLLLDAQRSRSVRLAVDAADGRIVVRSRDRLSEDPWLENAVGRLVERQGTAPAAPLCAPASPADSSGSEHYRRTAAVGLDYGPAFRVVVQAWTDGDAAVAELAPPDEADAEQWLLHPASLDGSFQLLVDLLGSGRDLATAPAFVPVRIERVQLLQPRRAVRWARALLRRSGGRSVVADFALHDADGVAVALLHGVRFRALRLARPRFDHHRRLVTRAVLAPRAPANGIAVLPQSPALAAACARRLHAAERVAARSRFLVEVEPLLDVLCAAFAERALRRVAPDDLAAAGRPMHPLLRRLLDMLEEDGLLERAGEHWRWRPEAGLPAPEDIWNSLVSDYPEYAWLASLVGHTGLQLAQLAAAPAPASTGGDASQASPARQMVAGEGVGAALADLLAVAAAHQAPGRRLRVLALRTQPPLMASGVAPAIDAGGCELVVAARDRALLGELEQLLGHAAEIERRVLDPESAAFDPTEAGGPFDIVLLPDGACDYQDVARALANLHSLLRQNGLLLLVEQFPSRAGDLAFGLDAAWWGVGGDGRAASRLRPPAAWRATLAEHGFDCEETVLDVPGADAGTYLLLARTVLPRDGGARGVPPAATWLVLQDAAGFSASLGERIGERLAACGQNVVRVVPGTHLDIDAGVARLDPHDAAHWSALLQRIVPASPGPLRWVHLYGLAAGAVPEAAEILLHEQQQRALALIAWLQAAAAAGPNCESWVVTAGTAGTLLPAAARGVPAEPGGGLRDAPLWGLARVAINEHPDLRIRCTDLAESAPAAELAALLSEELLWPDGEDEVVLARSGRYGLRFEPAARSRGAPPAADDRLHLEFSAPGSLRNLAWQRAAAGTPGADEVEIAVRAAGLNFRDVMYAMGLLPDEALEGGFSGQALGMELAGIVTRIGSDVTGLAPGDAVLAFAPCAFANRAITKAGAVVPKPAAWSFAAAATVPTAFFTAYYALHELARLREGDRVLVHGAAGGVGIAAIQIARHLGAEVFATAGTPEKRDFVRLLGADHVLDSRSLAFADEIMALTAGEGIDAVLNSLSGEAARRSLQLLKPFGRFLELGKRDFYENTRLGLRPFRNNIAYFGIDADQLMAHRPDLARRVFLDLMALFEAGALRPLPHRVFAATDAVDAFRYMQHSRQIGKVVLEFPDAFDPIVEPAAPAPLALRSDATYLVSGGLGGFGLRTAQWLARKGARHLLLLGRRGAASAEAREALAELQRQGVEARAVACDVGDRAALAAVLARVAAEGPPLRGVVHAAMVIDDALIRNMSAAQLQRVLAPKVLGALHLDELTRALPLDLFVLYSSATTLFGSPGQGNYVAANLLLEALARQRRAGGLPATCVAWGPIADAGYLARNVQIKEALLSRMGGAALPAAAALDALERLLAEDGGNVAVLDLDWPALRRWLPAAQAPKFAPLARRFTDDAAAGDETLDLRRWLDGLPEAELAPALSEILRREIGEILRIAPEKLDPERSLYEVGMDSLMGVELVTSVEARIGVALPLMALSEGPTIARLVERIVHQLRPAAGEAAGCAEPSLSQRVKQIAGQHAAEVGTEELEAFAADFAAADALAKPPAAAGRS